tara:strand:+ start:2205 stop:2609 length:405 start_codon:yes stop_codon:yes gene_type:complete
MQTQPSLENLYPKENLLYVFPNWIAVDGVEGGARAAPKAFMDRVGLPLFPTLKKVDDILTEHDVRNRLKIIASCKIVGARRQLIAFCLGNEVVVSDLGLMMSIGCIQAMQCGSNTYPGGITTHNTELEGVSISI